MREPTEGELFLRFEQLRALALDVAAYAQKRRLIQPDFKLDWLARPLIRRCLQNQFELSRSDVRWVMQRASEHLTA
jgi:hypothetical protein